MKIKVVELQLVKKYDIEIDSDNEYIFGIETAQSVFDKTIGKSNVEKVGVIFVDSTNKIINYSTIAMGNIDNVRLPLSELFKTALLCNSSKFIIAHNHPSGVLEITPPDIELTKKIGAIAKLFDMELIDSLIVNYSGDMISIREHLEEIVK